MTVDSPSERPAPVDTPLTITVNGRAHAVGADWTVAAALITHGYTRCRCDALGRPRGPFCLTGVCFECLVEIDGFPNRQACLTQVAPGMRVVLATPAEPLQ